MSTTATPLRYGPDDRPPLRTAVPLGLQHVMVMMASNVTIPVILASAIGSSPEDTAFLVQMALLVAGIATLIQTVGIGPVGARLPIVQGTSFGFLVVAIPLAQEYGLAAVFGGALFAGAVQITFGAVFTRIRHLFPPLVAGVVVLVIGIGLIPTGILLFAGGAGSDDLGSLRNLGVATFVLVAILLIYRFGKGFVGAAAVLFGLALGYLLATTLGMVDWGRVADERWVAAPQPLEFGLEFPAAALIAMGAMAVATSIETVGDISALTKTGDGREPTPREMRGGLMGDGLGTAVAALFSALPNTSFSQNVGLVAFTGVMSRFVVTIGGCFLIICGFVPKLAVVIAVVPAPVIGGAAVVMFGMIISAGISLITTNPLTHNDLIIIAVSVVVGQGFALRPEVAAQLPDNLAALFTSGIVPAAVIAAGLYWMKPKHERDADRPVGAEGHG
ncbi:purine permease [Nocardioides panacisoli]|uniref:uracil-xanthine permease family protein n=1 Tax=Nocardioides panacisoli TaxID=627624 RepID=UPI001C6315E9|nr:nucleobase:cation symporter-2 family protein [Nocardioides panacisoli]QYJ03059.1 purine permease [Nocardioides panacisoli]